MDFELSTKTLLTEWQKSFECVTGSIQNVTGVLNDLTARYGNTASSGVMMLEAFGFACVSICCAGDTVRGGWQGSGPVVSLASSL